MNTFNLGDKVRLRESVEQFYLTNLHGSELTVVKVDAYDDQVVFVIQTGSTSPGVWIKKRCLELAVERSEGEEIKPEAIRVGDEILVTQTTGEVTATRQGVVSEINSTKDQYGKRLIFTNKVHQRINWGQDREETFTLVKAAPERDVLMDRLVGALVGQVVLYRTSLARKRNDERWDILSSNGATLSHGTPDLRAIIGSSVVTWLAPEAKAV